MMIARFRTVGWVAGCAAAALCCYLASQQVASERLALARVDREIGDMRSDNMRLATEIATRSRLGQIERWNVSFRLGAPSPRQFLQNEVQLAAYAPGKPLPLDPAIVASKGAVRQVAYTPVPAPATPAPVTSVAATPAIPAIAAARTPLVTVSAPATPSTPLLRPATFVRAKPDRLAGGADTSLIKAALPKPASSLADLLDEPAPKAKPAPKRIASLLPSDFGALIAAESKSHKKAVK